MLPALELRGITKRFVAGVATCRVSADVLRCVDVSVAAGEAVAIVGGPAAGKSTLLLCAAGLLVPDSGDIRWFGDDSSAAALERSAYHFAGAPGDPPRRGTTVQPRIHLIDAPESLRAERLDRLATWIARRRARGDAIVVATREILLARRLADRSVSLRGGHAYADPPSRAARVAESAVRLVSGRETM
ncbi:MAG TPA: ATP-binding cassette domain-containing protein [Gemmatimonadaceae bacterium]|jgi:ABC-type sugar transport system ATPase subunit|nr:ATP-binding cassette domain-containing protein [Gemmatimonadaceae bacterium]